MRWGVRRGRSDSKVEDEDEDERVVEGTRVSFSIVTMRPRWDSLETRFWNAVCSSWEAGGWSVVCCEEGSLQTGN